MADNANEGEKPRLTQDLNLGPGVVVTPDYEVPEAKPRVVHSDRKITATGQIVDLPTKDGEFGSTYEHGGQGTAGPETANEDALAQSDPRRVRNRETKVATPADEA